MLIFTSKHGSVTGSTCTHVQTLECKGHILNLSWEWEGLTVWTNLVRGSKSIFQTGGLLGGSTRRGHGSLAS